MLSENHTTNSMMHTKISKIYSITLNLYKIKNSGSVKEKNNKKKERRRNNNTRKKNSDNSNRDKSVENSEKSKMSKERKETNKESKSYKNREINSSTETQIIKISNYANSLLVIAKP